MSLDASFDEESHWLDAQKDERKLDFYADEVAQTRGSTTTSTTKTLSENLNKIACLTPADAALTPLIISQIDRELLTKAKEGVGGDLSVIMREQTRDAAQRGYSTRHIHSQFCRIREVTVRKVQSVVTIIRTHIKKLCPELRKLRREKIKNIHKHVAVSL